MTGFADRAPVFPQVGLGDVSTGVHAMGAILAALLYRERTGEGQEIHLPMMETILSFTLVEHLWHGTFGEPEKGLGYPRMLTPHRRPYPTKDGFIAVLPYNDGQWRRFFQAVGKSHVLEADPRFADIASRTAVSNQSKP